MADRSSGFRLAAVLTAAWLLILSDDRLACHALSTTDHELGSLDDPGAAVAGLAAPVAEVKAAPDPREDFVQLLEKAAQHVCAQDAGLFCTMTQSLRPTYLSRSKADFSSVLTKLGGHFCASAQAQATDGCKLVHLLGIALPPTRLHAQAELDGDPVVEIDDRVDIANLKLSQEQHVMSDDEEEYLSTINKVSGNICEAGAGSLLCHISQGLEKHYKQACATLNNAPYVSFLTQTQSFYCGTGSGGDSSACDMFPMLLKGVPKPPTKERGTAKILGFLKVLDATVSYYCKSSETLFCHLSTGMKQMYLVSIKRHDPKSFQGFAAKVEHEFCSKPDQKASNRCRVVGLLVKGMPDLVHQDLTVQGLGQLPAITTGWSTEAAPVVPAPTAAPIPKTELIKANIRVAAKRRLENRRAPAEVGEAVEGPSYDSYRQAVVLLTSHYCDAASDAELCTRIRRLGTVLKTGMIQKDLKQYTKLLHGEKAQFCAGAKRHEHKTRCAAFSLLSDKLPVTPLGAQSAHISLEMKAQHDPELHGMVGKFEKMSCGGSNAVVCQLAKGLGQVYDREAGSARFYSLLSDISGHFCQGEDPVPGVQGCASLSSMLSCRHGVN